MCLPNDPNRSFFRNTGRPDLRSQIPRALSRRSAPVSLKPDGTDRTDGTAKMITLGLYFDMTEHTAGNRRNKQTEQFFQILWFEDHGTVLEKSIK